MSKFDYVVIAVLLSVLVVLIFKIYRVELTYGGYDAPKTTPVVSVPVKPTKSMRMMAEGNVNVIPVYGIDLSDAALLSYVSEVNKCAKSILDSMIIDMNEFKVYVNNNKQLTAPVNAKAGLEAAAGIVPIIKPTTSQIPTINPPPDNIPDVNVFIDDIKKNVMGILTEVMLDIRRPTILIKMGIHPVVSYVLENTLSVNPIVMNRYAVIATLGSIMIAFDGTKIKYGTPSKYDNMFAAFFQYLFTKSSKPSAIYRKLEQYSSQYFNGISLFSEGYLRTVIDTFSNMIMIYRNRGPYAGDIHNVAKMIQSISMESPDIDPLFKTYLPVTNISPKLMSNYKAQLNNMTSTMCNLLLHERDTIINSLFIRYENPNIADNLAELEHVLVYMFNTMVELLREIPNMKSALTRVLRSNRPDSTVSDIIINVAYLLYINSQNLDSTESLALAVNLVLKSLIRPVMSAYITGIESVYITLSPDISNIINEIIRDNARFVGHALLDRYIATYFQRGVPDLAVIDTIRPLLISTASAPPKVAPSVAAPPVSAAPPVAPSINNPYGPKVIPIPIPIPEVKQ